MVDNGHNPPKLGDVTLIRTGDESWRVERDGTAVASGLAFAQVTAIVRGQLAIDALLERQNGSHKKDKLE